ncbi:unnamed protein product [Cunninghamella blakesleeana]
MKKSLLKKSLFSIFHLLKFYYVMPIDINNVKSTIITVTSQQLFKRMDNKISPPSSITEEIIGANDMLHALHRDERELRVLAVLLSLAGGLVLSFLLGVGIFIYWHWRAYRTRRLKRKKKIMNKERGLSCTSLLSSTSTISSHAYTITSETHSTLNNNNNNSNNNTSPLSTITFFPSNHITDHPLPSPMQSIHPYQHHHQHRQQNDSIPSPTIITTVPSVSTSTSSFSLSTTTPIPISTLSHQAFIPNITHQASSSSSSPSSNIESIDNLEPIHNHINEKKQPLSALPDIPLMPPSLPLHPTCSSSSSTLPIPSAPTAKECLSMNENLIEQIDIPPPAYSYK